MNELHPPEVVPARVNPRFVHISRYRKSRFWAVWRGAELVAVTVYRKGAAHVAAELIKLDEYEEENRHHMPRLVQAA